MSELSFASSSGRLRMRKILPFLLALLAAVFAWLQLEVSNVLETDYVSIIAGQFPVYAPLNMLTAFCLTLVLFAVTGRWTWATGVSGTLFTVLAVANYYTRELHGSPLMPQDVTNIKTAAAVAGQYKLHLSKRILLIIGLYLLVLGLVFVQHKLRVGEPFRLWRLALRVGGCAAGVFAILYVGYFAPFALKPATTGGWTFQTTYYTYGYLGGTMEAVSLLVDPIVQPDNYTDAAAEDAAARARDYTPAVATVSEQEYPDIVLILSESFYDFDLVTDLQADTEIFSTIRNLDNCLQGHTVVPNIGGGTNASEYELLTGNSVFLMPGVTPFNWLDLNGADSVVSYLEDLGYATMAAHPCPGANYRRSSVWPVLGFDKQYFIEDFPTDETYGNRRFQTDSATYKDLEAMYESMPEDQPRFTFLVSIQSHGDYDMNEPELDIVHAATDYGEYDEVMDEYLSCMKKTDEAFGELTEYFTKVYEETGRKVIVAMAGDHAPSFVDHVADKTIAAENDLQVLERSTPFIIWANYPLENAGETNDRDPLNRMDLCMFMPTVAEQAGLPLTDYYKYLLAMQEDVTLMTAGNDYMDADGVTHVYGENQTNDDWVHGYFALEYNNIGTHAKKNDALFRLNG